MTLKSNFNVQRTTDNGPKPMLNGQRTTDQEQVTIRVGHSPDPDDAFMFYALAHDKIDTGDLRFRP